MYALRTRFKNQIVAEFLPPKNKSNKIIIFCDGMPGVPSKKPLLEFFAKKNYWVFHPRYRGSWESGGKFLKVSPERDILDIVSELPKGFKDLWNGKSYKIKPQSVYIIGSSFGGPAAILASRDKRVNKTVVFSPVIDWRVDSKVEPLGWLGKFMKEAFGEAYRFSDRDWNKLKTGKFYNPIEHVREIDGKKIFIIHAKDDKLVLLKPTQKFVKLTGSKLFLLKKGGHLSTSNAMKPRFYKKIHKFLR